MIRLPDIFFVFNFLYAGLVAEKLEWGNSDQINQILNKHSGGFDLVLGADIYILSLKCFIHFF